MAKAKTVTPPAKKQTNTVDTFRKTHVRDVAVPNRIRDGFAKMKANGDDYLYQIDFARLSGVALSDLNTYAAQFPDHTYETTDARPKVVWFVSARAKAAAIKPAKV